MRSEDPPWSAVGPPVLSSQPGSIWQPLLSESLVLLVSALWAAFALRTDRLDFRFPRDKNTTIIYCYTLSYIL